MSVLNVTPEAHAAVKAAAELAGVSMGAWASERLTAQAVSDEAFNALKTRLEGEVEQPFVRLSARASARSETPAETLRAALDALERPSACTVTEPCAWRREKQERFTACWNRVAEVCELTSETAPSLYDAVDLLCQQLRNAKAMLERPAPDPSLAPWERK